METALTFLVFCATSFCWYRIGYDAGGRAVVKSLLDALDKQKKDNSNV